MLSQNYIFFYFTAMFSQLFLLTYGRPNPVIRHDFTYLDSSKSYYKYHDTRSTWSEAVTKCQSEGAQLFYPENEKEAADVDELLHIFKQNELPKNIWIGVSNPDSELDNTVYKTIDGRSLNEVHDRWDRGDDEPDEFDTQHCVMMWSLYELWNEECDVNSTFICKFTPGNETISNEVSKTPDERENIDVIYSGEGKSTTEINRVDLDTDLRPNPVVHDDYIYMESTKSYYKYHDTEFTWREAVANCQSEGAWLFYPETEKEAADVDTLLHIFKQNAPPHNIWIGVFNPDSELDNTVYKTIDGRPINEVHNKWDRNWAEPDEFDTQHCVKMWGAYKLWNNACDLKRTYACKYTPGKVISNEFSATPKGNIDFVEPPTTLPTTETFRENIVTEVRPNPVVRDDYTYMESSNSYYKYHDTEFTWREAVANCQSEGAWLFYPETEKEAADVDTLLHIFKPNAPPNNIWIGVFNPDSELDNTVYKTIDGRPLNEVHNKWDRYWAEPDDFDVQHCVKMWGAFELWNTACDRKHTYACKYSPGKIISNEFSATTPSQQENVDFDETYTTETFRENIVSDGLPNPVKCDDYTYIESSKSYYKYHDTRSTWNEAVTKCQSEGAQLFYPENEKEAADVDKFLHIYKRNEQPYIWIGVSNPDSELDNTVYKTIDGRPFNEVHNKWDRRYDQPDEFDTQHCVIMWSLYELWNVECDIKITFICKFTPGTEIVPDRNEVSETPGRRENIDTSMKYTTETNRVDFDTEVRPNPVVSDDYTYMESSNSYYKYHDTELTWREAVANCQSEGAWLFYPETEREAAGVDTLLHIFKLNSIPYNIWIGVFNPDSESDNTVYKTIDGRPLNEVHNKWDTNYAEPNEFDTQHCVELWRAYELWNTACDQKRTYACKYTPEKIISNEFSATTPSQQENGAFDEAYTTETFRENLVTGGGSGSNVNTDYLIVAVSDELHSNNSNVQFGNVVADELSKFPTKEKFQVMAAILKVIKEQRKKMPAQ